ncbi:outer membrane beta-barrel protein [Pedobacter sp. NJ-S-72]
MKKLLTIAMLCASALATNAQTEKGKFILGGTIGYSSDKMDQQQTLNKHNNLTILPSGGYFVKDNLALGLGIGYSRVIDKYTYNTNNISQTYSQKGTTDYFMISPFVRHYINISDKFKFFSQFSVPMKWGNIKSETESKNPAIEFTPDSTKTTSIGVGIEPGFAFFPTKKIGIQLSVDGLSYVWSKTEDKANSFNKDQKSHAFNLGTNFFAPRIGIQFYF